MLSSSAARTPPKSHQMLFSSQSLPVQGQQMLPAPHPPWNVKAAVALSHADQTAKVLKIQNLQKALMPNGTAKLRRTDT